MPGRTYTETFEIEMDKEEMAVLGASLGDGRVLGDVLLGHVSAVVARAQSQVPGMLGVIDIPLPDLRTILEPRKIEAIPIKEKK